MGGGGWVSHFIPPPEAHTSLLGLSATWENGSSGSLAHKVHTTVAPGVTQDILQNPQLEWAWEIATQHAY